ncbi:MAG TPA: hypothetical protein VNR38_22405 [Ureibacillus sp.]|nr:hypothetical protein [Ureibacillus sp.]
MNKKKFVLDSLFNMVAMAIPILVLQLFTLPFLGFRLGEDDYGMVVTLISLYTLLSFPFGNVLNNIRLLFDEEYKKEELSGDFNVLLSTSFVLSILLMLVGMIFYVNQSSILDIVLMLIITGLNLLREYLVVAFRIKLNFKAIMYNNYILGLGYVYGTYLFYVTGIWQFIFILGFGFSLIYIIKNSDLILEPYVKTRLFKKTTYNSVILLLSSLLGNLLTYADKLLIFPLLGPKAVSIYYASTLIGKLSSMVITPINGVILSYLAKLEMITMKTFFKILCITGVVGVIGYVLSILISPFVLHLLYPIWATESLDYILVTTATAIVGIVSTVVQPFILKFTHMNWQLVINGSNVMVYVFFSILLYQQFGLMGFCIGILISSIYQLVLMIGIFIFNNKKQIHKSA